MLCCSLEFREKAIRLFGIQGDQWRQDLANVLGITVEVTDEMSRQICLKCSLCVAAVARLRITACESEERYLGRKICKETSDDGASP